MVGVVALTGQPADARRMMDQLLAKLPDDDYAQTMAALVKQLP
jgi:hypothetical protein